jgi:hypothetical protein
MCIDYTKEENMEKIDLLNQFLQRPIAYHKSLVGIAGVTGAVMLSQAMYWTNKLDEDRNGWFWKTQEEWENETGLTRYEQEGARKKLVSAGVLEEKLTGIPAKLWFRISVEGILAFLEGNRQVCGKPTNKDGENPQTGMGKNHIHTIHRLPIDYSHSENSEKNSEEEEETQFSIFQKKNRELQEKKEYRKQKKLLKKENPFINNFQIEKRLGSNLVISVPQTISKEYQSFIDDFNKRFLTSNRKATPAGQKLWDEARRTYSAEQIKVAAFIAMGDDWWRKNFTPVLFFRTENDGKYIDNIDKFLNKKGLTPEQGLLKKEILENND